MVDFGAYMTNFTVGPVQSPSCVHEIGARDVPYFRTPEFSATMLESERILLALAHAPANSRAVFLTGSGTAGMEAAVMNLLSSRDRAIVVDGGSFGHRFAQICAIHGVPHERISLDPGRALRPAHLEPFAGRGFTALLVNMHETSTGVLYDMPMIADFCRREGLFLLVDAISSFLADPFDMASLGAGAMVAGSQKAMACPPGVSLLALAPDALARIDANDPGCLYFDLRAALKDGERGQTPFTPAVGTLLQIHARLREIEAAGGAASEIVRTAALAADFRGRIADLPFDFLSESPSNAVTALRVRNRSARAIFSVLKDRYGIWICPNGGDLADDVFRVGHLGALESEDNAALAAALHDLHSSGLF